MKKINTLIVGAGRVAQHYAKIFNTYQNELSVFQVTEVVDVDFDKAKSLSKLLGGEVSTSLSDTLARSTFDLAIILTPSHLHFNHGKAALLADCNVLVEKPSTLLIEDSNLLKKIAEERNLTLGTVVQNRLNKATQFARQVIQEGLIGKIQTVAVRLIWSRKQEYYEDEWHGRWLTDGGVLSQQGFHHLDISRYLCGDISSVFSLGRALRHNIEVDDTSVGIFEYENGALGTIELTTTAPQDDIEASIKVLGSHGLIEIAGIALNKISNFYSEKLTESEIKIYQSSNSEDFANGYGLSHFRVLEMIAKDVSSKTKSYFSWEDTTKTLELVHSLYKSQEIGQAIKIGNGDKSSRLGVKL